MAENDRYRARRDPSPPPPSVTPPNRPPTPVLFTTKHRSSQCSAHVSKNFYYKCTYIVPYYHTWYYYVRILYIVQYARSRIHPHFNGRNVSQPWSDFYRPPVYAVSPSSKVYLYIYIYYIPTVGAVRIPYNIIIVLQTLKHLLLIILFAHRRILYKMNVHNIIYCVMYEHSKIHDGDYDSKNRWRSTPTLRFRVNIVHRLLTG